MKQNLKRLVLGVYLVLALVMITACAKNQIEDENIKILENSTATIIDQITSADITQNLDAAIANSQSNNNQIYVDALTAYKEALHEAGPYLSREKITVEKSGTSYVGKCDLQFERRVMNFSITVKKDGDGLMYEPQSIVMTPRYSLAENMKSALANTLVGMGTVFLVLIFISLVISMFKYVNKWESSRKGKTTKAPAAAVPEKKLEAAVRGEEPDLVQDEELVAVITAAIAAAENTGTGDLVVRSIRRVKNSRWKRA